MIQGAGVQNPNKQRKQQAVRVVGNHNGECAHLASDLDKTVVTLDEGDISGEVVLAGKHGDSSLWWSAKVLSLSPKDAISKGGYPPLSSYAPSRLV
jgi:hypothetical protein